MCVLGCKCRDTTCYDRAIEDIRDAPNDNLEEIEPRNAITSTTTPVAPSNREPVSCATEAADASTRQIAPRVSVARMMQRYRQDIIDENKKQITPRENKDSLTIATSLGKISEDIDLTRAVSRQQLGIPGWLYPNATMDKEPSYTRDDVRTTRSATARTSQSREIHSSPGCSTANLVRTLENGRPDLPQDDRVDDKRGDLACAVDVKYIRI
jgi:hypothetical protein